MLKDINKIVVLSGGSGNDAILEALIKDQGYDPENISIIVNAYDDGKSTGICREVTGTLGVSDIRKNHEKLHKIIHGDNVNKDLMSLYENRVDNPDLMITKYKIFNEDIHEFFMRPSSEVFEYDNFNIMNIIYSNRFDMLGYEFTNYLMSDMLKIPDMVKLNSFDNIKIVAETTYGQIITDEGDIVEWKNAYDPIRDIHFVGKQVRGLNKESLELVEEADLIVISTGTFWSSIYPTLKYQDFYRCINKSKAKKLWIVNSEQDKDAYGVSSDDFHHYLSKLGLNTSQFDILMNSEADEILKEDINTRGECYIEDLGNKDGRNDHHKVSEALEKIYG